MKKETAKQVLKALVNAHPVNTSNDISVSIRDLSWSSYDEVWFNVYSNLTYGGFTECSLRLFLSLAEVFNVNVSISSNDGVPVIRIS